MVGLAEAWFKRRRRSRYSGGLPPTSKMGASASNSGAAARTAEIRGAELRTLDEMTHLPSIGSIIRPHSGLDSIGVRG